jgi:TonB-linked SusC/RagA family outer membrane protein
MKAVLHNCKGVLCILALLFFAHSAWSQKATGRVLAADTKEALPGATILVAGTTRGAVADAEGKFSVDAHPGENLQVTYVGYTARTLPIDLTHPMEILLDPGTQLSEVLVVTSLGVRKDKARLGYAVQEVAGEDLTKAREPNPINSLVGKVSGLTIGASPELLGNPNISLRGGTPIFVVDGVPINSDTWNISADDIETYTVLKGPSAAALYGFRSQDGVIMITTKKGSKEKGTHIELNTSQMIQSGFNAIPKVQNQYGPGDHGQYAFVDGRGGGLNDGDYDIWGPRFEGQSISQYDSPVNPDGTRQGTPWVARGVNNLERFLRPGFQSNNNIAVSTNTEKSQFRYSTSYNYTGGMVPNTQLNVANFNFSAGTDISDNVRLDANINYNRQFTDNIPDVSYGPNSMIYNIIIWGGADWDISKLRNYWQPGKEGVQEIYEEYQRYNNPWFLSYEWLRGHQKTDIYGQTSLSWKIAPGLKLTGRTAVTTYDILRSEKFPYSATVYGREERRGDYREDKRSLFENNTDVLLDFDQHIGDNFSVKALAGGNIRTFKYNSSYTTTDYLNVPGLYTFSNSANPLKAWTYASQMQVYSGYYSVDFGYKNILFLSHTGRVDKLSTLPAQNNTFFYPSLGASAVISEMFKSLGFVSFLKVRGSYANVKAGLTGSTIGTNPSAAFPLSYGSQYYSSYGGPTYQNASVYSSPVVYNGQPGSYYTNTIVNANLKPLSRSSYEVGADAKFLHNRLGLEATYFLYIDGPQIFNQPISEASGYTSLLLNAVKVKKQGIELSISGTPVKLQNGLKWDVLANWSTYRRTLYELPANSDRYNTYFKVGDRLDAYYDQAVLHTPDGQIINDASGRPILNAKPQFLGYSDADWVWGLYNKVTWKTLSLGFQFDGRVGGVITDYIQRQTMRGGRNVMTVEGAMGDARYSDWVNQKLGLVDHPQENGHYVGAGVVISNGVAPTFDAYGNITNYNQLQFATNTTKTFLQDYISRYYQTAEANLISKTYAKLREVTITWQVPAIWCQHTHFIRTATISLVGRNLLYFSKHKDIDLDNYIDSNYSGLQTPTAKSYGINMNFTF